MAINRSKITKAANVFKVISHPTRLEILMLLEAKKKLTVSQLCAKLDVEQSLVSHHLAAMRRKGVLKFTRDGINISYEISDSIVLDIVNQVLRSKLMK